ncbi:hypothetical protein BDV95DRAFT_586760 [Massariosphaeria phaeospora]|uniref:Uncharacterized protein n=1 Tax=Massariosphaeria phaeospora TaxID=100035 RepID=A0A7C8I533_9PLEO|nr:hypothetical protein BDV95DRAFT_586760 [Massariosphaeria phaeospora]
MLGVGLRSVGLGYGGSWPKRGTDTCVSYHTHTQPLQRHRHPIDRLCVARRRSNQEGWAPALEAVAGGRGLTRAESPGAGYLRGACGPCAQERPGCRRMRRQITGSCQIASWQGAGWSLARVEAAGWGGGEDAAAGGCSRRVGVRVPLASVLLPARERRAVCVTARTAAQPC